MAEKVLTHVMHQSSYPIACSVLSLGATWSWICYWRCHAKIGIHLFESNRVRDPATTLTRPRPELCFRACPRQLTKGITTGVLLYRGYPIEQLAEKSDFVDTTHLLLYGELPDAKQKKALDDELKYHSMVHEKLIDFYRGFKSDAHPMAIMVGVVGAISAFYEPNGVGGAKWRDHENARKSCVRLIAKMPTLAAMAYKSSIGQPIVYPRNDYTMSENFLYMMFAKKNEVRASTLFAEGCASPSSDSSRFRLNVLMSARTQSHTRMTDLSQ
eukprot:6488056-Pyramimonas_sp.AAC.2